VYGGNSLVVIGDRVELYYTGDRATHGATDNATAIGQVWWPRDRFVGLAAGAAGGSVTLKPQRARGALHLNADAGRGQIVVELAGQGTVATCRGDALDHAVPVPPACEGRAVEVTLHLTDAEVFSSWWE
jgi:hypothetical protein